MRSSKESSSSPSTKVGKADYEYEYEYEAEYEAELDDAGLSSNCDAPLPAKRPNAALRLRPASELGPMVLCYVFDAEASRQKGHACLSLFLSHAGQAPTTAAQWLSLAEARDWTAARSTTSDDAAMLDQLVPVHSIASASRTKRRAAETYGYAPERHGPSCLTEAARRGALFIKEQAGTVARQVTVAAGDAWSLFVQILPREAEQYAVTFLLQRCADTFELREITLLASSSSFVADGQLHTLDCTSEGAIELVMTEIWRTRHDLGPTELGEFLGRMERLAPELAIDLQALSGWRIVAAEKPTGRLVILDLHSDKPSARFDFVYGPDLQVRGYEQNSRLYDAVNKTCVLRDLSAELSLTKSLEGLPGLKPLLNRRAHYLVTGEMLLELIRAAAEEGISVFYEEKRLAALTGAKVEASATGIDWFELKGEFRFGTELLGLPALLRALDTGGSLVSLSDGSFGLLDEDWALRLKLFTRFARDQHAYRFAKAQLGLVDAAFGSSTGMCYDEALEKLAGELRESACLAPAPAGAGFHGALRSYQKIGLGWLLRLERTGFGGCLADDMGLGKTIQVLALLNEIKAGRAGDGAKRGPSLIVAPRSLISNWLAEARRFTPELTVLDHSQANRADLRSDFASVDVVLTTYSVLRLDAEHFTSSRFDWVVLDEAQTIKNANAQIAKVCKSLQASRRLALSGTPIENHLGELKSIFEFLNPGLIPQGGLLAKTLRRGTGVDPEGMALARRVLAPFILRRTKAQVLTELPGKEEQTLYCDMSSHQKHAYDELRDHYRSVLLAGGPATGTGRSKIEVLAALLRLRQAACHPALIDHEQAAQSSAKLDLLVERLEEIRACGEKALVFSQFTSFLALVQDRLKQKGLSYAYLDGKTKRRDECVRKFQEDPDCSVFVISLKAGGVGLNLTAASYCFLLDPWWNPATEAQAIDRCYRIGQTKPVMAYRLITRGTVEEKVLELQATKRSLGDAVMPTDESILGSLSLGELTSLLS